MSKSALIFAAIFNILILFPAYAYYREPGYQSWQESPRPVQINSYSPGLAPILSANWYWGIGGGVERLKGNRTFQVTSSPCDLTLAPETDFYTTKKSNIGLLDLSGGRIWQRRTIWFPAFGTSIRYRHLFRTNIGNQIQQFSLMNVPTYDYHLDISSNIVTLQGKIDLAHYSIMAPYASVGLGFASTHVESYNEAPIGLTPNRANPGYASKTNNHFAYNLGAGLDFKFSRQVIISAGYEYQQLGNLISGYGSDSWAEERLNLGRYAGNVFLVSISFLFA